MIDSIGKDKTLHWLTRIGCSRFVSYALQDSWTINLQMSSILLLSKAYTFHTIERARFNIGHSHVLCPFFQATSVGRTKKRSLSITFLQKMQKRTFCVPMNSSELISGGLIGITSSSSAILKTKWRKSQIPTEHKFIKERPHSGTCTIRNADGSSAIAIGSRRYHLDGNVFSSRN